jgi:hypothetical protein
MQIICISPFFALIAGRFSWPAYYVSFPIVRKIYRAVVLSNLSYVRNLSVRDSRGEVKSSVFCQVMTKRHAI